MDEERFALPSGTVTFLLTDIEGSSRRWETDPDHMAPAVARHYEILDEAVARWGGVRPVEQGEGDSIVAAFARASDGVAAAAEAQRALTAELGDVFTVRMALHTGEAQLRDEGNYFGDAVNRCARVRACGHGGQILCTRTVVDLVAERLPQGVRLVDLGRHRLRDLGRHEQIWQVSAEDLPATFPPLRSLDAFRHNLPTELSSFVGRSAELHELRDTLTARNTRLITLVGAGGCGKTRLALRLAVEIVDRYAGGVWWTELAPSSDRSEVAQAVLHAVGLREEPTRPHLDVVSDALTDETTLVVLDNCEHVLADAARVAQDLLERCGGLTVLATSREPLGVPGEIVWRVPSLAAPDEPATDVGRPVEIERLSQLASVRLFLERAREARPNFVITESNAPAVAQICFRLDGIPLAIELAAARCRTLTPERIATELDDRFRLLTGGARTATPRQQTLLASVDWSHQLLDRTESAVFRRLSVFAAPFTLDAAETVCADGDTVQRMDVLDLVLRLVDKSLVAQAEPRAGAPGEPRYRLLETVRQYALDRCHAADELEVTRDRHLDHYLELVEGFDWSPDAPALADAEYPNIRAALVWAMRTAVKAMRMVVGFEGTWALLGRCSDVRELWAGLLEGGRAADEVLWAHAVTCLNDALLFAGDASALPLLPDALDIGVRHGHLATVSRARFVMGAANPADWREHWAAGREAGIAADDVVGWACAMGEAQGHLLSGDLDERWERQYDDALATVQRSCLATGARLQSGLLGTWASFLRGDIRSAAARIEQALDAVGQGFVDTDSAHSLALAHGYLGLLTGDDRCFEVARDVAGAARGQTGELIGAVYVDALARCEDLHAGRLPAPPAPQFYRTGWVSDLAAGAVLARMVAGVESVGSLPNSSPAPYGACRDTLIAAWSAMITGDAEGAAYGAVHDALATAHDRGYRLVVVECLESLAALTDDRAGWSRLLGAADRARTDMGIAFRWPHLTALLGGRPSSLDLDAFEVGRTLDLDGAVELVRRTRGSRGRPNHGWASLTPTERAVVERVVAGRTNGQIGEDLLMSRATVKTHLTHIFSKLGVTNRAELAVFAATRTNHRS